MKQSRNTHAKTEILKLIDQSAKAWSHADIQEQLGDLCNRVTIYRILERLEEEGQVHRIVNTDGVINYARCRHGEAHQPHEDGHGHIHFSCERCRAVVCIENVVPKIHLPEGYISKSFNFVVSGVCAECSEKEK